MGGKRSVCLCLGDRLALVQCVSSQMAVFTMQHEEIYLACFELGYIVSASGTGGGVCSCFESMNKELLGKVAWNVLVKPEKLCSVILREKYGRGVELDKECIVKGGFKVVEMFG